MDIRPSLEPFALSASGAARTWGGRAAQTCDRRGFQPCLPAPGRPQLLHCPEPPLPNPASLQNRPPPASSSPAQRRGGQPGTSAHAPLSPTSGSWPRPQESGSLARRKRPRACARGTPWAGERRPGRLRADRFRLGDGVARAQCVALVGALLRRSCSDRFFIVFFLRVAGGGVQSGRSASRTRAKGHRGTEKVGAETPGVGNHVTSELKPGVERTEVEGIERPGRKRGVAGAPFWSHP